jgi:hypothetical protein
MPWVYIAETKEIRGVFKNIKEFCVLWDLNRETCSISENWEDTTKPEFRSTPVSFVPFDISYEQIKFYLTFS